MAKAAAAKLAQDQKFSFTRRCPSIEAPWWFVKISDATQRFVDSPLFDFGSGFFVLFYTVQVGIATDWAAQNLGKDPPGLFLAIEIVFCLLFTAELTARLVGGRSKFFVGDG